MVVAGFTTNAYARHEGLCHAPDDTSGTWRPTVSMFLATHLCAGLLRKASHRSCRESRDDGLAAVRPSPEVVGSSLELPTVGRMAEAVTRMAQKPSSNPNPPAQVRSPSTATSSTGAMDIKIDSLVDFIVK